MTEAASQIEAELRTLVQKLSGPREYALCRVLLRNLDALAREQPHLLQRRLFWERQVEAQRLRMAVSADGTTRAPTGDKKLLHSLKLLDERLQQEVELLETSHANLKDSSAQIDKVASLYDEYGQRLASAKVLLSDLKRRSEEDSCFVFWAFVLLVSVCGFIIGKRTKLFKMAFALTKPLRFLLSLIHF